MYDIIISNASIYDGSGNPWFKSDIGIKSGKIVSIGQLRNEEAQRRIDVSQFAVAPGFIDIHCHSDALLFASPREKGKILQGVTTEVIGNCGISATPVSEKNLELLKKYTSSIFANIDMPWDWRTVSDFLRRVEERRSITNIASLVGHGAVRIAVMGFDNRDPDERELAEMKRLVASAIDDGAFGLSSGLIYPPGLYAKTRELIELCRVVAEKGGIYTTHMRGETDTVIESVKEAIRTGEESGVPVQISHHKTGGLDNWGKCRQTLQLIAEARDRGLDITCDAYPYIAGSTMLGALLPPWVHEGGVERLLERLRNPECRLTIKEQIKNGIPGWENFVKACGWDKIVIASCNRNKSIEGKNLEEIAHSRKIEPDEALFDIMIEEEADVLMIQFMMCEEDVSYILRHPLVMMGSDAIPSAGKPHPRYYGAFPRFLRKYVLDEGICSLAEGIRKITSMPAQKLGLRDRGAIREGMWADITVFDPKTIADKATFLDPQQFAAGVEYVLVNGRLAVDKGEYTGLLEGRVLRR